MNAPVVLPREMRKPVFPAAVHTYTDALRVLSQASSPMSAAALAEATVRDKANLRRDLQKLRDAGVITLAGEGASITAKGRDWVRGQDVAEGLLVLSADAAATRGASGVPRAPYHAFRPNPDQPRKSFDDTMIAGIADTIAEAGDVLQPTLVRPRDPADALDGDDANPIRMFWAGEQRWRAIGLLIEQDRLPAKLDPAKGGGIPYVEREAQPGSTAFLALIENGARAPLDPLEEAFAFVDYMNDTGITSARQVAINTGRAGRGDEKGVRTVQIRIKVAREATPEAIEDYRRTRDWNALVEKVQQKGETHEERRDREIRQGCNGLMGRRRLALIELAHKAVMEPLENGGWKGGGHGLATATRCPRNDETGAVTALVQHVGGMFGSADGFVPAAAVDWLIAEGLLDPENPATTLAAAWREHGLLEATIAGRLDATPTTWSTEWLNVALAPAESDAPSLFEPPARPVANLPGRSAITLAEILFIAAQGEDEGLLPGAIAGKYWLDANLSGMKDAGLVGIFHEPAQPPVVRVYETGVVALFTAAAERGVDLSLPIDSEQLDKVREAWIPEGWLGSGYVTDWLNDVPTAIPDPATDNVPATRILQPADGPAITVEVVAMPRLASRPQLGATIELAQRPDGRWISGILYSDGQSGAHSRPHVRDLSHGDGYPSRQEALAAGGVRLHDQADRAPSIPSQAIEADRRRVIRWLTETLEAEGIVVDWTALAIATEQDFNPGSPAVAAALEDDEDTRTVEDILGVALSDLAREGDPADGADFLAGLFAKTGLKAPFIVGGQDQECVVFDAVGEGVLVVDWDRELGEGLARSRAILIAATLNAALRLPVDFSRPGVPATDEAAQ